MNCSSCGTANRDGRRFCASCGAPLAVTCTACGFQNEGGARFCGGCGSNLSSRPASETAEVVAAPAPAEGADRRPVSVMFIDLAGYTAMSSGQDPEDTHRLLRRFFEVVDGLIVSFGGTIDKHIGDNVMALFGAPVARGKDAERAVRAALAVHAAMPALSAEFGRNLSVHIGMALGEVVASGLGSASHSAYTVTGDAANLAARLMDLAGGGETLVSEPLRHATETMAIFAPRDQLAVKGLAQPQTCYTLVGLASEPAAEAPLVGRGSELGQLLPLLDACRSDGRGAAAAIRGDPGIGKSRLLREVERAALHRGFRHVRSSVLDFGARPGEDAIAAIAAGLLGTAVEQSAAEKTAAIAGAVAGGRIVPADAGFVHDLLGLQQATEMQAIYAAMDAKTRRRGKSEALAQLAMSAAAAQPLLLAVEDMHWADDEARAHLARLAAVSAQSPVVTVMTTRFDGDPFDQDWRAQSSGALATTIDLRPLRSEDATRLAQELKADADDFARACVQRAEGNPLFLEQLLRSRTTDADSPLPHTLQGVVLARLDGLPETDRRALQAACVLGQRFTPAAVAHLLGVERQDFQTLIRRHLIKPEGDGYLIAHALIRDGVYASLTRDRRRNLHLSAASYFAELSPVLRAEHLDRAEDPAAAAAYLAAAELEARSYRLDQAIAMARRGLTLAPSAEDTVRIGLTLGRLLLNTGEAGPARVAFESALQAADGSLDRCRALVGMAAANRVLSAIDEALAALDAAQPLAIAAGADALLSEIHYLRGNLHFARGRREECLGQHHLALAAAERAGEAEWQARAHSGLGDAAYLQGRMSSAVRNFRTCIEIARRNGLLRIIPANQCMVGDSLMFNLDLQDSIAQIVEARALAVQIGDRFCEMFSHQSEAFVHYALGRFPEAEAPARAARDQANKIGARRYEAILLCILAEVRMAQQRPDEARAMLDDAYAIGAETGFGFCGPIICSGYARLSGATPDGRQWIDRGLDMLASARLAHNDIFFRKGAIDWAIGAGDWALVDRMCGELLALTEAEPLAYVDFYVGRARALAALQQNPEDAQAAETLARLSQQAQQIDLRPVW
ncbi:MAG: adenylate/guanylate cyclase domain-containing protein [Hyphomicrobiales bacterium]